MSTCLICDGVITAEEDVGQLLCSTDCLMVWNTRRLFAVLNDRKERDE